MLFQLAQDIHEATRIQVTLAGEIVTAGNGGEEIKNLRNKLIENQVRTQQMKEKVKIFEEGADNDQKNLTDFRKEISRLDERIGTINRKHDIEIAEMKTQHTETQKKLEETKNELRETRKALEEVTQIVKGLVNG